MRESENWDNTLGGTNEDGQADLLEFDMEQSKDNSEGKDSLINMLKQQSKVRRSAK